MRSRVPGASVRDPAKADGLAFSRVRVRRGNFAQPDTLLQAFEGATQVLLASSNARAADGDTLAQHRAAIPAAVGARRIVYTSQAAASATSEFPPMWDHATTEEVLRGSGLAWTALRNGFYGSSGLRIMGEAPQDGPVAWTAHADLAQAAAAVRADEGASTGRRRP